MSQGFFGGATVGLNLQSGAIVLGFEGEGGYLGLRGSAIEPNDLPTTNDTVTRFKSGAYGALYGRLGFSTGNALIYGKGGGAFLDAKSSTIDPCVWPPGICSGVWPSCIHATIAPCVHHAPAAAASTAPCPT